MLSRVQRFVGSKDTVMIIVLRIMPVVAFTLWLDTLLLEYYSVKRGHQFGIESKSSYGVAPFLMTIGLQNSN